MAYSETANLCSFDVYERNLQRRVFEDNLEEGGLYTYMMLLGGEHNLAAYQATRLESITKGTGVVSVKFAFLDEELNTTVEYTETMQNGIIRVAPNAVFESRDAGASYKIDQSYLRDFFDEFHNPLLSESIERELELVH